MKAMWIHDHVFYSDKDKDFYSQTGVSYHTFKRFLPYCDSLTIVGRKKDLLEKEKDKLVLCNGEKVYFSLMSSTKKTTDFLFRKREIKKELKSKISETDYCIILLPSRLGQIAVELCEELNKPYIVNVIGCIFDTYWNHGSLGGKILAIPSFISTKKAIYNSSYVMYITESFLQTRYPTKGYQGNAIANVIIGNHNDECLKKKIEKIKVWSKEKVIKIGLIGSLDVDYKGHGIAFKALKELSLEYPNIVLELVGPGSPTRWRKQIKKLDIEKNVIFKGTIPSGEPINQWLDSLDFYIQPSKSEGHGRSVVEAMSRACVVVASNVGGLKDSIDQEYLHDKRDYLLLAELIKNFLENEEKAIQAAENNFMKSKDFTLEKIEEKRRKFILYFLENKEK